jgi:hypothetical protein
MALEYPHDLANIAPAAPAQSGCHGRCPNLWTSVRAPMTVVRSLERPFVARCARVLRVASAANKCFLTGERVVINVHPIFMPKELHSFLYVLIRYKGVRRTEGIFEFPIERRHENLGLAAC